jgi:hypothetical protein
MLQAKEHAPTSYLSALFTFGLIVESIKEFGGASIKVILGGGALSVLAHFKALCCIASHFPFCLFPFIIDDTHIIGPPLIVSSTYEHF